MQTQFYVTPESTIYRVVSDELVVIQLNTGLFYYFSQSTKEVFEFFKTPRSLDAFFHAAEIATNPAEKDYVTVFMKLLLEEKVIETASAGDSLAERLYSYTRPSLLRRGEKTLDELAFLCP